MGLTEMLRAQLLAGHLIWANPVRDILTAGQIMHGLHLLTS